MSKQEELIQQLKNDNPYPDTVFLPIKERDMVRIAQYLKDGGFSSDALYGSWGRDVWNNCVKRFEALAEEEALLCGQEELIQALAEKWAIVHKSTCNLSQNWFEAEQALADTPEKFRDESWQMAYEEMREKKNTCTCGVKKLLISDLRALLSQLVPGEEENFPLAFIDWLGENFLWDKYMRYYVPRDTDMENAKYLKTVKEAYYYWMSLTD